MPVIVKEESKNRTRSDSSHFDYVDNNPLEKKKRLKEDQRHP